MPGPTVESGSPERTCIGCRRRAPAATLVRVTTDRAGRLVVGHHGHGRGAWVCLQRGCIDRAVRRKAFGRALRAPVCSEDLARITEELEGLTTEHERI